MDMLYRTNKIYVGDSSVHGRGVFASERIKQGEIIEECHFFLAPNNLEYPQIFRDHFFAWPKGGSDLAICLGYGSIFNHSGGDWNADWETDTTKMKYIFYATREIEPGEEIFTNYQRS